MGTSNIFLQTATDPLIKPEKYSESVFQLKTLANKQIIRCFNNDIRNEHH